MTRLPAAVVLSAILLGLLSCLPAPASSVEPGRDSRPAASAFVAIDSVIPSVAAIETNYPAPSPSRTPARRLVVASWYADRKAAPDALYAAAPGYDGHPYPVAVCSYLGGVTRCVTVVVQDFCQCYVGTAAERAIDLAPAAFAQLAPLSRGLVPVTVEVVR